jgi:hypothetical protein
MDKRKNLDKSSPSEKGERHPLFGALKGFTHIPPGVDLTEPADPDWGKICDQNSNSSDED